MPIEDIFTRIASRAGAADSVDLITQALTLVGRVPLEQAMASLSLSETFAIDCIRSLALPINRDDGNFVLAFRPHGRLFFSSPEEFQASAAPLHLIGYIHLPQQCLMEFHQKRLAQHRLLEGGRAQIVSYFEEFGYDTVLATVSFAVEHMAPLTYYAGDHGVSSVPGIAESAAPGESSFAHAIAEIGQRRQAARIEHLTAVACLWLLLRSGANDRAQELNASQISLETVWRFFKQKKRQYGQKHKAAVAGWSRFNSAGVLQQAGLLSAMRQQVAATGAR